MENVPKIRANSIKMINIRQKGSFFLLDAQKKNQVNLKKFGDELAES